MAAISVDEMMGSTGKLGSSLYKAMISITDFLIVIASRALSCEINADIEVIEISLFKK